MKCRIFMMFSIFIFVAQCWSRIPPKTNSNQAKHHAEWTIMAYMNGHDNDLQRAALCDFYEMLSSSFSSAINVVVELSLDGDLPIKSGTTTAPCRKIEPFSLTIPYWRGTRRFQIRDHGARHRIKPRISDLGKPEELQSFVTWARNNFPAKHYMLVLWSHGKPIPRALMLPEGLSGKFGLDDGKPETLDNHQQLSEEDNIAFHRLTDGTAISLYKRGSSHVLLNSEIRKFLKKALKGRKLDIIAFDACAKSMIETAFALQDVANLMVATEELTPEAGWDYHDWLPRLNDNPRISPAELGNILVDSYRLTYEQDSRNDLTTQASMDLAKLTCLVAQIDTLAELLIQHSELGDTVIKVRNSITPFAFQSIDFTAFVSSLLAELQQQHPDPKIVDSLEIIQRLLKAFIAQPPYASGHSVDTHQSHGVAIYFPPTQDAYRHDTDFRYYDPGSPYAIPFFKEHAWGRFLKAVLP